MLLRIIELFDEKDGVQTLEYQIVLVCDHVLIPSRLDRIWCLPANPRSRFASVMATLNQSRISSSIEPARCGRMGFSRPRSRRLPSLSKVPDSRAKSPVSNVSTFATRRPSNLVRNRPRGAHCIAMAGVGPWPPVKDIASDRSALIPRIAEFGEYATLNSSPPAPGP